MNMWVDPARREIVSLDLEDKKNGTAPRIANIPLKSLRQIGDVILVQDETAMYGGDLDSRYGFVYLTGLEVRTRSGKVLGKVRDFFFSPDSGAISRVVYDPFGLAFLPLNFFDLFSLPISAVISIGRASLTVTDESEYKQQKEGAGIFGAIPSLLRTISAPVDGTADSYRGGGGGGALPKDYTYEQWQFDVRRWEQETGMSYEQYQRLDQQRARPAAPRALPPPARAAMLPPQYEQQQQRVMEPAQRRMPEAAGPSRRPMPQDPRVRRQPPPQQQQYSGGGAPPPQQQQAPYGAPPPQQQQQAPYGGPPRQAYADTPAAPGGNGQQGYTGGPPGNGTGGAEPVRRIDEWMDRDAGGRMEQIVGEGGRGVGREVGPGGLPPFQQ